jgi:hypothetical protein
MHTQIVMDRNGRHGLDPKDRAAVEMAMDRFAELTRRGYIAAKHSGESKRSTRRPRRRCSCRRRLGMMFPLADRSVWTADNFRRAVGALRGEPPGVADLVSRAEALLRAHALSATS